AIEDFKKLQFSTEYQLRLEQIINSHQINPLDSSQYQKLREDLRSSLISRFKIRKELVVKTLVVEEKIAPESPTQSVLSFGLKGTRSNSFVSSKSHSEIKIRTIDKKNRTSQLLSLVLHGKENEYLIYKFDSNGNFDKSVDQPLVKEIDPNDDENKKLMENKLKKLHEMEKCRMRENHEKVYKFVNDQLIFS
ncbi:hypothetical protein BpHYR1_044664, partial [Brachionus plicatilis]